MQLSPFGQKLRGFRRLLGLSQLELASRAQTTPRHVSFIETGRSRPGRELVLRLAECLDLPVRERNELLTAAGLAPEFAEHGFDELELYPFRMAVEAVLDRHDPYPACAVDALGRVLMTNAGFRAFSPGSVDLSPEEAVDALLGPGPMREMIENFAEVAWAYVDSQRREVARTNDPRLAELTERAVQLLARVERPRAEANLGPPLVCPRFRIGDQVIRTFSTVMRFEHPKEVTLSELRVELIFPMDETGDHFFRGLVESTGQP